jgi:hypothetical protein
MIASDDEWTHRSIFEARDDVLLPTGLARGPWYPGTQHGSTMLGLLARAVERHPSDRAMQVTRLTVDFSRAAPLGAVTTPTQLVHGGRSVEVVEARIEAGGETYARATGLRFRLEDIDLTGASPRYGMGPRHPLPAPGEGPQLPALNESDVEAFHLALEMRPTMAALVPAMWFRLRCPFVAGEETSPFVRAAVIADWTYSIPFMQELLLDPHSARRERDFTTINPDTSLNLHRPMIGEWLCMDSHVHYADCGAGSAMALLHDETGPVGHASQSILIRGPDKRPILDDELRQRDQD